MVSGSDMLREAARWVPRALTQPFGRPVMLVFHGVVERLTDPRIEVNHHEMREFVAIAEALKTQFDVLPLTALAEVLAAPQKHSRAVFLTADDGYRNLLGLGRDILDAHGLPWSLFVSTRHIDTGDPNPLLLARLFLCFAPPGDYRIPHVPSSIVLNQDRDAVLGTVIDRLKRLPREKAQESIGAMVDSVPRDRWCEWLARFPSEQFLNWDEVRMLSGSGVEIGAHAEYHWPMNSAQSKEALAAQARNARSMVIEHVGRCRYFAYPFGNVRDVSADAWTAVRDAGYEHAFTTLSATLDRSGNPWLMPRYMLKPAERRLSSLLPMLRAGNRRLGKWQRELAA